MRSLKLYVALFSVFVLQSMAPTVGSVPKAIEAPSSLEKCLNISTNQTRDCMKIYLKRKTLDGCYTLAEGIYSNQSKERAKDYCFYEISAFPNLKSCVDNAKKFFLAENKDQALFECVRQSAALISVKSCLKVSKMMTYQEKRNHLINQCNNL